MDCTSKATIMVKIGRTGGRVKEFAVANGTFVRDVVKLAGLEIATGEGVYIGSKYISLDSYAIDNSILLINKLPYYAQNVAMITVKVARINEPLQLVRIIRGSSVEMALISAGRLPFNNEDIWIHREGEIHGKKVDKYTQVNEGEIVIIEPRRGLYEKILECVEDGSLNEDECTAAICAMLKKDYHIE